MTSDSRHRHADGPAANPDEGPETVVLPGRSGATPPHRHAEDPLPPPALPAASGTGRAAAPPEAPTEETGWPAPGWALYRCERLLGVGGMGRVYLAWDNRLNRRVAVKFLSGDDPECVQRFFREARAQARIDHPHVGKVYEVGEVHGRPYIAMQFIAAMQRLRPTLDRKRRVLVVCHAGIATAWLLVARMQAEFPDVDIVGVASILELHNSIQLDGLDAVISTLPTEIKELPAVVVSPLLDSRDVERIQQALWPEETNAPSGMLTGALDTREASMVDLVTPETIRLRVTAQSWQDVVRAASKPLLDIGAIGPEYVEAIRHALVEYGPYMVTWPGVALLHALPREGVKRLCMSLVTLSEPVPFGHPENDPVDIAVVLGALNDRSHVRALLELQAALETGVADEIRSAPNAKRVVELLAESLSWQNGKAAK